MRRARPWLILFAAGIVLAMAFAPWMFNEGAYDPAVAIAELVAGVLLLQLPAVAWRMAGGPFMPALVLAIIGPLIVVEIWLGISAAKNQDLGGDLQGVEYTLMWVVIAPIVISALIVSLTARWLIPIRGSTED